MGHTLSRRTGAIAIAAFVVLVCIVQLVPFYIALTTSLKQKTDLSSQLSFPTADLFLGNFAAAVADGGILRAMFNSVITTTASTLLVCLVGAFAAYPLARRATLLNRGVLALVVGLMMVPALSILVPLYTLLADLGLLNSYVGVILVMVATSLPMSIFLYASFMRSLPISIEEAATIDGANRMQVMWHIVIPMLRPVTATVAILTGVGVWNEFALSGYILTTPEMRTIAPAIASFFSIQSSNLPAATAASLLAVVPVIVAYLFLQKYFIRGITGAEK